MNNKSERPKRERPELTELKLLLEQQIEAMEDDIERANDC